MREWLEANCIRDWVMESIYISIIDCQYDTARHWHCYFQNWHGVNFSNQWKNWLEMAIKRIILFVDKWKKQPWTIFIKFWSPSHNNPFDWYLQMVSWCIFATMNKLQEREWSRWIESELRWWNQSTSWILTVSMTLQDIDIDISKIGLVSTSEMDDIIGLIWQ